MTNVKQTTGDYLPVPVEAAREIARAFAKQIVVVLSIDRAFGMTHFTTYGVTAGDKMIAANIGEELQALYALKPRTTSEDFRLRSQAEAAETIERLTAEVETLKAEVAELNFLRGSHP